MTKHATPAPPPSFAEPIEWHEEWLGVGDIQRSKTLQVRAKLNPKAVSHYRDMTRAGRVPPLIKVAEVTQDGATSYFLVDGWHRWEAGALVTEGSPATGGELVRALVAPMTMAEAALQAAAANLDHGERLKRGEMVEVFKAFVRAGRHRTPKGYRSYREMSAMMGVPHTTLLRWMRQHFRKIADRIGGTEGADTGGLREREPGPSVADEILTEVERIKGLAMGLPQVERDHVIHGLFTLLEGITKPKRPLEDTLDEF